MTVRPMIPDFLRVIEEGSRLLGVGIESGEATKMVCYAELLMEWSLRTNLTSLRDPVDIAVFHFLDSLTVFKVAPRFAGFRVLDVGSGAGFPGMVMRIADGSLHVTLLDRNPRKIVFLKEVARKLDLTGISFFNKKLETLLEDRETRPFDLVVSRALSSAPGFFERLHAVLATNGLLVRMGGPASVCEESTLAHFRQSAMWEGTLPFSESFRRVSLYERIA